MKTWKKQPEMTHVGTWTIHLHRVRHWHTANKMQVQSWTWKHCGCKCLLNHWVSKPWVLQTHHNPVPMTGLSAGTGKQLLYILFTSDYSLLFFCVLSYVSFVLRHLCSDTCRMNPYDLYSPSLCPLSKKPDHFSETGLTQSVAGVNVHHSTVEYF